MVVCVVSLMYKMKKFAIVALFVTLFGNALAQPEIITICDGIRGETTRLSVGGFSPGTVPKGCWKENNRGFVYCINANITSIPQNLPLSTTCLVIEQGHINSVDASSINYLPNLKVLGLFASGVQTVFGAFTHPQLEVLAITEGGMKNIPAVTNRKLTKLILRSNDIQNVDLTPIAGNPVRALDLSQNPFTDFPTSSLSVVGNSLTNLSVKPSEVEHIDDKSFATIPHVKHLQVAAYTIKADAFLKLSPSLNVDTFAFSTCVIESFGLRGLLLTKLRMGYSRACKDPSQSLTIQPNSFYGMTALKHLDLDSTRLTAVPKDAFQGLPALTEALWIDFNIVKDIKQGALNGLSRVYQLSLTNNQGIVPTIPVDIFSSAGLTKLGLLDLSAFNIQFLPNTTFENLPELIYLYLGYNRIRTLNEAVLKPVLDHLQSLTLYQNLWLCDCKLRWLRELFDKQRGLFDISTLYLWTCDAPLNLKGKLFTLISPSEFVC